MTTPTTRLTIAESNELHRLKRTINDSAEAVESLVKSLKEQSRQALAESVIGGSALARVREIVGPKDFQKWIQQNVRLSAEQAATFAVLAKSGDALATQRGLIDALRALGALE